eukprot:symbB.v1.2.025033.t1/scaffold2409.1/size79984/1
MSFTPTLQEDTPPATPPRRQLEEDDVCCVCLEAMRPGARGAQRAVPIPTCNRHGMHLECMAQWRVEGASRQHLQCPLCQNGHQQHGQAGGWLPEHDERLAALCIAEHVPPPERRGGAETAQIQVRDYAVRTFTRHDAPEPPAPIHITVYCCPRVAAVREGPNQVSFVDLPGREAPPPAMLAPTQALTSPIREDRSGWYDRGPPNGLVTTDRNSWCYVPLLLAAAGLLHPVAAAQWRADPRSHAWWDHACRRLRQAQPVPADTIVEAMWIAAGEREPLLLQRLQHAARDHPPPALVDLAWCLRHCSHDDGYIPAPAQEMCLQIYGGLTMSSELDRFTNGYRTREQVHRRLADIPPPEPDSEPERSQTAPAIGSPLGMSRQAWESLDSISVQDEFQTPVASLQAACAERAAAQVRRGELSRARQTLTSSPLAPGTDETLAILQDPTRRPPALQTALPTNLQEYQPQAPIRLNPQEVAEALRTAKRGSAPGLSGATAEHYKVLLDDEEGLSLFTATLELLAQGQVPEAAMATLSTARLTALSKPNGGVRGIATGEVLRRIASRVLARQYAEIFDAATRPFQYALRTRAGTDCLAAILRTAAELDESATIVSLDGRAAYDTASRAAMFHKLFEVAPALVPFVRGIYGRTSVFYWWNDQGVRKEILQAEGCHQGDPLAPALYSLAQHQALENASRQLAPGEYLAAYLDDIYIVGGVAPEGIQELGPDVWRGNRPLHEQGILTLDAAARCVAELLAGPAARAPSLRQANAAADQLREGGWSTIPAWDTLQAAQAPPSNGRPEIGTGYPGWQQPAARALHIHYRESELLPHLTPPCQALLRSQSGPHAAAWLTAIPTEPALTIASDHFQTALRRRLRLPLALADRRCGGGGNPGCGAVVDPYGDHRAACARSGLLARRAPLLEQAWVRVCREGVGGEGRVVPQQWLARTTAPGVRDDDRRRLDLVVYGATRHGSALCCDVTLVSPLRANGHPQPRTAREDGAALVTARRRKRDRYPELLRPGPQRLVVLACEIGGRWAAECCDLVRDLLRVRAPRAPPALRQASRAGWERRWWALLSCAQQNAVASTLLGNVWRSPSQAWEADGPPLSEVLRLVDPTEPSRLPLRS